MNDTEKLNLILEHAEEYYKNKRLYHFVKDGFVAYEFFRTAGENAIYIAEIYVSPKSRGGEPFKELLKFCLSTERTHGIKIAYTRTEKNNKYLPNMQKMYNIIGFKEVSQDKEAIYYRLDV